MTTNLKTGDIVTLLFYIFNMFGRWGCEPLLQAVSFPVWQAQDRGSYRLLRVNACAGWETGLRCRHVQTLSKCVARQYFRQHGQIGPDAMRLIREWSWRRSSTSFFRFSFSWSWSWDSVPVAGWGFISQQLPTTPSRDVPYRQLAQGVGVDARP